MFFYLFFNISLFFKNNFCIFVEILNVKMKINNNLLIGREVIINEDNINGVIINIKPHNNEYIYTVLTVGNVIDDENNRKECHYNGLTIINSEINENNKHYIVCGILYRADDTIEYDIELISSNIDDCGSYINDNSKSICMYKTYKIVHVYLNQQSKEIIDEYISSKISNSITEPEYNESELIDYVPLLDREGSNEFKKKMKNISNTYMTPYFEARVEYFSNKSTKHTSKSVEEYVNDEVKKEMNSIIKETQVSSFKINNYEYYVFDRKSLLLFAMKTKHRKLV